MTTSKAIDMMTGSHTKTTIDDVRTRYADFLEHCWTYDLDNNGAEDGKVFLLKSVLRDHLYNLHRQIHTFHRGRVDQQLAQVRIALRDFKANPSDNQAANLERAQMWLERFNSQLELYQAMYDTAQAIHLEALQERWVPPKLNTVPRSAANTEKAQTAAVTDTEAYLAAKFGITGDDTDDTFAPRTDGVSQSDDDDEVQLEVR